MVAWSPGADFAQGESAPAASSEQGDGHGEPNSPERMKAFREALNAPPEEKRPIPLPDGFTLFPQGPQQGDKVGTYPQLGSELHRACFKLNAEKVVELFAAGSKTGNRFRANALDLQTAPLEMVCRRPCEKPGDDEKMATIVKTLIDAGAEINGAIEGEFPLILASTGSGGNFSKVKAVRLLIAAGADLRARDRTQKMTALHWAVTSGFPDTVEALLEAGASATSVTGSKPTPFLSAKQIAEKYLKTYLSMQQGRGGNNYICRKVPMDDEGKAQLEAELRLIVKLTTQAAEKRAAAKSAKKEKVAAAAVPVS